MGNNPYLQGLMAFAQQHGYHVTSSMGGQHNPGSLHYQGRAIDIANQGVDYNQLVAQAKANGYRVLNELHRMPGEAVWGGPHYHIDTGLSQQPASHTGMMPKPQQHMGQLGVLDTSAPQPSNQLAASAFASPGTQLPSVDDSPIALRNSTPQLANNGSPPLPATPDKSMMTTLMDKMKPTKIAEGLGLAALGGMAGGGGQPLKGSVQQNPYLNNILQLQDMTQPYRQNPAIQMGALKGSPQAGPLSLAFQQQLPMNLLQQYQQYPMNQQYQGLM